MKGSLFINDKDAFVTWGVVMQKGAYNSILLPPSNKAYTTNDQRSSSGVQVFYENIQPSDRTFNISFVILADTKQDYLSKYKSFVDELSNGQVIMRITELKTVYKLHVDGYLNLNNYMNKQGILNVRFSEPNIKERIYL